MLLVALVILNVVGSTLLLILQCYEEAIVYDLVIDSCFVVVNAWALVSNGGSGADILSLLSPIVSISFTLGGLHRK